MKYLYRTGDGNEGNFPRFIVDCSTAPDACPFEILRELALSEFNPEWRAWAADALHLDGDAEHGVYATIYEGPDGEEAYGAAWFTAELQPGADVPYHVDTWDVEAVAPGAVPPFTAKRAAHLDPVTPEGTGRSAMQCVAVAQTDMPGDLYTLMSYVGGYCIDRPAWAPVGNTALGSGGRGLIHADYIG